MPAPTNSRPTISCCAASARRSICRAKIRAWSPPTTPASSSASPTYIAGATCAARRTCSANKCCWPAGWSKHGCGFVTVMDAGWDMHSNNNSPGIWPACTGSGHQVDHAVAAFLEDVEAARPVGQDYADRHGRDGPHAAHRPNRRPRPLGDLTPLLSRAADSRWGR